MLRFLVAATGISRQQMERLVRQWRDTGSVRDRRGGGRGRPFARKYTAADIRLLAEVDEAFDQMSGLATREVLRRQCEVFGEAAYERLAAISNGHVYNLRGSATYRAARTAWTKTKGSGVSIGLRQAPEPEGMPGHVRVDTVHQGDRDGVKGIYLINLVDEVTQFEFVGAVVGISERFLVPLLEGLLLSFPFPILGFHADNGSEYINHRVAALLEKLRVERFTKSRARRSNDNALVEGKNANVVRKWFGHDHIPQLLRARGQPLRPGHAVAVPQLPPALPVRHRVPRRQRPDPAQVPRRRRHDPLRPAALAARRRAVPQARNRLRPARRGRRRGDRPRGRPPRPGRTPGAVPPHRRRHGHRPRRRLRARPPAAKTAGGRRERLGPRRVNPLRGSSASLRPFG